MNLTVDPRAKGLIFDMDGTLADSMPVHFLAWEATGTKHGFLYPRETFYRNAGMPSADIVRFVNRGQGLDLDPEFVSREKERAFLAMIDRIRPIDDVFAIVKQSFGRIPLAVGTGEYRAIADRVIDVIGVRPYLTVIVAADDVRRPKPDPETFLRCAERMGVAPESCQVFEDGEPGLIAGERAGMIVIDVRPYLR